METKYKGIKLDNNNIIKIAVPTFKVPNKKKKEKIECQYCQKKFSDETQKTLHQRFCNLTIEKREQPTDNVVIPTSTKHKGELSIGNETFYNGIQPNNTELILNNNEIRPKVPEFEEPMSYKDENNRVIQILSHLSLGIFKFIKEKHYNKVVEVQCMYIEELNCIIINENDRKFAGLFNTNNFTLRDIINTEITTVEDTWKTSSNFEKIIFKRWLAKLKQSLILNSNRNIRYNGVAKKVIDLINKNLDKSIQKININNEEINLVSLKEKILIYDLYEKRAKPYQEKIHAELVHADLLESIGDQKPKYQSNVYVAGTKRPCLTCYEEFHTGDFGSLKVYSDIFQSGFLFAGQLYNSSDESLKNIINCLNSDHSECMVETGIKIGNKKFRSSAIRTLSDTDVDGKDLGKIEDLEDLFNP